MYLSINVSLVLKKKCENSALIYFTTLYNYNTCEMRGRPTDTAGSVYYIFNYSAGVSRKSETSESKIRRFARHLPVGFRAPVLCLRCYEIYCISQHTLDRNVIKAEHLNQSTHRSYVLIPISITFLSSPLLVRPTSPLLLMSQYRVERRERHTVLIH